MQVTLVAHTMMSSIPDSVEDTSFDNFWINNEAALLNDADTLAHFAGRSCYQAWEMPNPSTRTNECYISNIINQGHFSVLEHASATFYIEGVSRNLTHELIRHRHLSYSELSQRYVKMDDAIITVHPTLDTEPFGVEEWSMLGAVQREAITTYEALVKRLEAAGIKGKKAREAARTVIPGGVETKIVVTGNHRAWRDMLHKRYSVHADAEIRELATKLLTELRRLAPATYQDFPDEPFK